MKIKISSKVIQFCVFVFLIFSFTLNHYQINTSCKKWIKVSHKKIDINAINSLATGNDNYVKSADVYEELSVCDKYNFWPSSISFKMGISHRIPADLIFIFIGAGIIYFTRDINKSNKS
ncbi:MAG: hypothetical protein PHQ18_04825 [Patescibacteria group bacterium]|nr:hypothetical protein [Patescibacteria group bacterium]